MTLKDNKKHSKLLMITTKIDFGENRVFFCFCLAFWFFQSLQSQSKTCNRQTLKMSCVFNKINKTMEV